MKMLLIIFKRCLFRETGWIGGADRLGTVGGGSQNYFNRFTSDRCGLSGGCDGSALGIEVFGFDAKSVVLSRYSTDDAFETQESFDLLDSPNSILNLSR